MKIKYLCRDEVRDMCITDISLMENKLKNTIDMYLIGGTYYLGKNKYYTYKIKFDDSIVVPYMKYLGTYENTYNLNYKIGCEISVYICNRCGRIDEHFYKVNRLLLCDICLKELIKYDYDLVQLNEKDKFGNSLYKLEISKSGTEDNKLLVLWFVAPPKRLERWYNCEGNVKLLAAENTDTPILLIEGDCKLDWEFKKNKHYGYFDPTNVKYVYNRYIAFYDKSKDKLISMDYTDYFLMYA